MRRKIRIEIGIEKGSGVGIRNGVSTGGTRGDRVVIFCATLNDTDCMRSWSGVHRQASQRVFIGLKCLLKAF